jgi:hypothetical protein
MSEQCRWLHDQLDFLRLFRYPFIKEELPDNGIYFFYEEGETWGHGGDNPRIVRIGTHKKDKNFQKRMCKHFSHRRRESVFRRNIGSALLKKNHDPYLATWEKNGKVLNKSKEHGLEKDITVILENKFSFRFIIVPEKEMRVGPEGLERYLIGTVAKCDLCIPSSDWLGKNFPKDEIRRRLWLTEHINERAINEKEQQAIEDAIEQTKAWLKQPN